MLDAAGALTAPNLINASDLHVPPKCLDLQEESYNVERILNLLMHCLHPPRSSHLNMLSLHEHYTLQCRRSRTMWSASWRCGRPLAAAARNT